MMRAVLILFLVASSSAFAQVVPTFDLNCPDTGHWWVNKSGGSSQTDGWLFGTYDQPMYITVTINAELVFFDGGHWAIRPATGNDVETFVADIRVSSHQNIGGVFQFDSSGVDLTMIGDVLANNPIAQGHTGGFSIQSSYNDTYGVLKVPAAFMTNASFQEYDAEFGTNSYFSNLQVGSYFIDIGQAPTSGNTSGDTAQAIRDLQEFLEEELDDLGALIDEMMRDPQTETPYLSLILQELQTLEVDVDLDETNQILSDLLVAQNNSSFAIAQIGSLLSTGDPGEEPDGEQMGSDHSVSIDGETYLEPVNIDTSALRETGMSNNKFTLSVDTESWGWTIMQAPPSFHAEVDLTWAVPLRDVFASLLIISHNMWGAFRIWRELSKSGGESVS